MKIAVVVGTSKADGNTRYLVNQFVELTQAKVFDLSDYKISYYDYLILFNLLMSFLVKKIFSNLVLLNNS